MIHSRPGRPKAGQGLVVMMMMMVIMRTVTEVVMNMIIYDD